MLRKRILLLSFTSAVVLSAILRLCQLLAMTEYTTGFIRRDRAVPFYALSVIIVLFAVFVGLFALANDPRGKKNRSFHLTVSVSSILLGAAVVFDLPLVLLSGAPRFLIVPCVCLGVLCALYLAAFGIRSVVHFPLSAKFAALPPAFFTARSAVSFISYSRQAVTSDAVFEVSVFCLFLLFLLEIARAVNGGGNKNSAKKIALFGLFSSIFAICSSLPKIILSLFYSDALHDSARGSVLILFAGVYAACIVFARFDFSPDKDHRMGVYYVGKH